MTARPDRLHDDRRRFDHGRPPRHRDAFGPGAWISGGPLGVRTDRWPDPERHTRAAAGLLRRREYGVLGGRPVPSCPVTGRQRHHAAGAAPDGRSPAGADAIALVALAVLFGPLGVLLGTPLTVALYVAVNQPYLRDTLREDVDIPGES